MILDDVFGFAKECHSNAKSKGWWDKYRSTDDCVVLMITELAEAVEAYRSNAPYEIIDGKPEGEIVEMADYLIRAGDLIGYLLTTGLTPVRPSSYSMSCVNSHSDKMAFYAYMMNYTAKMLDQGTIEGLCSHLYESFFICYRFAKVHFPDQSFDSVIREKITYNNTRAYRHGNKNA